MTEKSDPEIKTFEEDDSFELPPSDIITFNELRSCYDLYRMSMQGILIIQPEFQREIVWKPNEQTRFIDSLVKQLPIPSMCFSLDYKSQKWQVIDGLQRMWTIKRFLSDEHWQLSKLDDIDPKLSGKSVSEFIDKNSELHQFYTKVENLTIPITVVRCDYSKKSHTNYLYKIFHRLNAGGTKLNNQEIRNCIFRGPFNDLLKELEKEQQWMVLSKMKKITGYRYTKQELILRFFAFNDDYQNYDGHLSRFLNDYMHQNQNPDSNYLRNKKALFRHTINVVYDSIFDGKMPSKLSISILEGVLVGVSLNLPFVENQNSLKIKAMYEKLLLQNDFREENLREGLAGRQRVISRIATAKRVFSGQ